MRKADRFRYLWPAFLVSFRPRFSSAFCNIKPPTASAVAVVRRSATNPINMPSPQAACASFEIEQRSAPQDAPLTPRGITGNASSALLSNIAEESKTHTDDPYSDVTWSILSNAFFVSGGMLYIVGSAWDWKLQGASVDEGMQQLLYKSIYVLGPLVYLLNAVVDVAWAVKSNKKNKQRRAMVNPRFSGQNTVDAVSSDDKAAEIAANMSLLEGKEADLAHGRPTGARKNLKIRPEKIVRRLRRHFGHRRELSAATAFGIAAVLALAAAIIDLLQPYNDQTVGQLFGVSVHMYLVSAIFSMPCGRKGAASSDAPDATKLRCQENAESLETFGDAFFGIASIVDVILFDFHFDDDILAWGVVASSLWLADALLYLRSDFVTLYDTNRREELKAVNGIFDGFDAVTCDSPRQRVDPSTFIVDTTEGASIM